MRDRGNRGSDHAGAVLAGNDQHSEHTDRQLGQENTTQADLSRVETEDTSVRTDGLIESMRAQRAEQRPKASDDHDRREQAVPGRAQRAQLNPLGANDAELRDPPRTEIDRTQLGRRGHR